MSENEEPGKTKKNRVGVKIGTSPIDGLQARSFLHDKGLSHTGPFQLELVFADTMNESQRSIPNDYARSSLFTARNKREPRRSLQGEKLFHLSEDVSVTFTGIELRAEDDEIIWLQILHYAKSVPLGEPFGFTIKQLVVDVGWSKNGRYYEKARECISRLKANEVMVVNGKAYGKSGAISLIDKYTTVNDSDGKANHYQVWIDPNLILLFAGNTFTNHSWETYRKLSPVARRLADYVDSHKHPYPLSLERFQRMCGCFNSVKAGWRRTVREACDELREAKIVKSALVNTSDGKIYPVKN